MEALGFQERAEAFKPLETSNTELAHHLFWCILSAGVFSSQPRFKRWRNRLHTSWWEKLQSHSTRQMDTGKNRDRTDSHLCNQFKVCRKFFHSFCHIVNAQKLLATSNMILSLNFDPWKLELAGIIRNSGPLCTLAFWMDTKGIKDFTEENPYGLKLPLWWEPWEGSEKENKSASSQVNVRASLYQPYGHAACAFT